MAKFMVMSAVTLDGKSQNRARCFELNATDLPDMATAQGVADERNAAEKAAGHDNVKWYATEQWDMASLMAKLA